MAGELLIFAGLNFRGQKTILEKGEHLSPSKFRTLTHCCAGSQLSGSFCRILLSPHLADAIPMPSSRATFAPVSTAHPHSLGLLIQHLRECVEGYNTALEEHERQSRKLEGGSLGAEDIRTVSCHGNCDSIIGIAFCTTLKHISDPHVATV